MPVEEKFHKELAEARGTRGERKDDASENNEKKSHYTNGFENSLH